MVLKAVLSVENTAALVWMRRMKMEIIPINGHYEVYIDGEFYCSADTYEEAEREIEDGN